MSARERKNDSGQKPVGFYVYCITERKSLEPIFAEALPDAIEVDAALEMITQNNLAAVASPVPLSEYGEDELPRHLTDATWTAIRAMRHERVAEHFARRVSIVPLRFGTIYTKRERVEQMLAERSAELMAIIERLQGREEWGLNLYFDRAKFLEKIISLSPRLREMAGQAETASPGQAYLMRKKIESLRETEARAELQRLILKIEKELGSVGPGVKRLRVLKDEATERGELAAKFAILVERKGFDRFHAVAERLAEELTDAGLQVELTGPWPAYNFAADQ
jgi:Gas vesicle synthesis protein GvpL/GvpF